MLQKVNLSYFTELTSNFKININKNMTFKVQIQ